jgi:hypothetical protein
MLAHQPPADFGSVHAADLASGRRPIRVSRVVSYRFGQKPALLRRMKNFLTTALIGAVMTIPVTLAPTPLNAADQKYHDKAHNDDHEWNSHEDKAYRAWAKENHRKYVPFTKLKEDDQQSYWGWRHEHSDAVLKINIR